MAAIAVQDAKDGLAALTFSAANAGGDTVEQGSRAGGWDLGVVLVVSNGDAGDHDVTVHGVAHTVTAGEIGVIPVFGIYKGQAVDVTYDGVTSVTVGAFALSA